MCARKKIFDIGYVFAQRPNCPINYSDCVCDSPDMFNGMPIPEYHPSIPSEAKVSLRRKCKRSSFWLNLCQDSVGIYLNVV